MSSRRKEQQAEVRFQVLRLICDNPTMSTRQIAQRVGISNGAAYYCLSALVDKGLIKIGNFTSSPRKRSYVYLLTPRGMREKSSLTKRFLERKLQEFDDLKREIAQLEREAQLGAEAQPSPTGRELRG